jgi:hypothetical protein
VRAPSNSRRVVDGCANVWKAARLAALLSKGAIDPRGDFLERDDAWDPREQCSCLLLDIPPRVGVPGNQSHDFRGSTAAGRRGTARARRLTF